jgi:hypothetical protein
VVESLLKWPLDSQQFLDALVAATATDVEEAMRQIDVTVDAFEERQARIERRLEELGEPGD